MDLAGMRADLAAVVKGRDRILDDLCPFLLERMRQPSGAGRPLASLCFLGAPATGKTMLAEALSQYLYRDKRLELPWEELIDFEAPFKIAGLPPGYYGNHPGGRVTVPVIENPRRVIVWDYFERFDKSARPLLLQTLTEAKLQDARSGQIADFSQSIVILTSAAAWFQYEPFFAQISDKAEASKAVIDWWVNPKDRPEDPQEVGFRSQVLSSLDKTYVFEPLAPFAVLEIAVQKAMELATEFELALEWMDPAILLDVAKRAEFHARELDHQLYHLLGDKLRAAKEAGRVRVRIELGEQGPVVIPAQSSNPDPSQQQIAPLAS
jgi:ATP-dependent Clp protease ATP-binding subunit ClpA